MQEEKASAGDPLKIRASTWNDLMDCLADWKARQQNGRGGRENLGDDNNTILVKNDTDNPLPRFSVLGIGPQVFPGSECAPLLYTADTNLDGFKNGPVFYGAVPRLSSGYAIVAYRGLWCVIQEPAAPNAIVRACIAGVTPARLHKPSTFHQSSSAWNVASMLSHGYADVVAGETGYLEPQIGGGAQIVTFAGSLDDDDCLWAVVRLGSVATPVFVGTTQEELTTSGSSDQAVEVHSGDLNTNVPKVYTSGWLSGLTLPPYVDVKIRWNPQKHRPEIVEVPTLDGTLTTSVSSGGSGTFTYRGTSYTLTVHAPWVMGDAIDADTKVKIAWDPKYRYWEIRGRGC